MFTRDDLIDMIMAHLERLDSAALRASGGFPAAGQAALKPAPPPGKTFLSEYDIKKMLAPGAKELSVAKDAIVSPLAQDWLTLRGINIKRG